MTREEAIKKLELQKNEYLDKYIDFAGIAEAYDMAIKALEQEPCEDAISRAEAIRIASGYCHWSNVPEELERLPSVQPKTRAGHWELPEMAYDSNIWRKCSCCGVHHECFTKYEPKSPSMYAGETFYSRKRMDFCPNCGADMRETDEEL